MSEQNNKNPEICLYHSTTAKKLPEILTNGLSIYSSLRCEDPLHELAEEEGIDLESDEYSDMVMECKEFNIRNELDEELGRSEGVYFVKSESDILDYEAVIEVPAHLIPCRCIEDNYDLENELYDMIASNYDDWSAGTDQEDIWEKVDEVKATMRPLDTQENEYVTEVVCPCDIPPEIIAEYGSGTFDPVCPKRKKWW